jgi:hypothetical protein
MTVQRNFATCAAGVSLLILAACGAVHQSTSSGQSPAAQGAPTPTATLGGAVSTQTVRPDVSGTAEPSSTPSGGPSGVSLESVNWSGILYPIDCAPLPPLQVSPQYFHVYQVSYAAPHTGVKLAVVLVSCNAGAGTPPRTLLVYDRANSTTAPHLAQTLFDIHDNWVTFSGFSIAGATISIPVEGYSSANVCRACENISTTLTWAWQGSQYVETSHEPPHYRIS